MGIISPPASSASLAPPARALPRRAVELKFSHPQLTSFDSASPNLWRYGDSNPRPSHCERDALPTELYPQYDYFSGYIPISKQECCVTIPKNPIDSAAKRSPSQLLRSIPNVPCLKRHQINGNYYAIKKIRSKIKTHALRSKAASPLQTERSLSENCASSWFGRGRRAFNLPAFFQIIGQPICRRFFASSFCVQSTCPRRL